MAYLSNIELHNWVNMIGLLTRPVDKMNLMLIDLFWMDRNRWYFFFYWGTDEEREAVQ